MREIIDLLVKLMMKTDHIKGWKKHIGKLL